MIGCSTRYLFFDTERRIIFEELFLLKNNFRRISFLKNENEFLRERLEVMTYTLSDLNNQIKSKDQEKESLLTAIRLIYDDSKIKSSDAALHETNNVEDSLEGDNEAYQTIHNKRKQPNVNKSALATAATSPFSTNQYSILSVQEIPDGNDTRTVIESDDVVEVKQVIKPTTPRDKTQIRVLIPVRKPQETKNIYPATVQNLKIKIVINRNTNVMTR